VQAPGSQGQHDLNRHIFTPAKRTANRRVDHAYLVEAVLVRERSAPDPREPTVRQLQRSPFHFWVDIADPSFRL
jgi:hypothetical protein